MAKDITFNISVPKEKKTVLMDALEYHDIIFTCTLQEDKNHYYFTFELSPMDLFELAALTKSTWDILKEKSGKQNNQQNQKNANANTKLYHKD